MWALTEISNVEELKFHVSVALHRTEQHKVCIHCNGGDCQSFKTYLKAKMLKAKK